MQAGTILIDKPGSGVESVSGGLCLHDKVFHDYQEGFMKGGNWVVVQAEFNLLGLVELSGQDKIIQKYFSHPAYERNERTLIDKAAHFTHGSGNQLSYLAKQFHSLTSDAPRLTPEAHAHVSSDERSPEAIMIASRFLPDLSNIVTLEPKPTTAEEYFARELEIELRNQPPMYQPEKKY